MEAEAAQPLPPEVRSDQLLSRPVAVPALPEPGPKSPAREWVRALRPRQWTKNVLVFMAPAAAGVLTHGDILLKTLACFGIFCLVASGTYLVNDLIDAEADRLHPKKRLRPIAAGTVSDRLAVSSAAAFFVVGLGASWWLAGWQLFLAVAVYVAINVNYCLWMKRLPVIELACVAAGFVLRAVAGGLATHVPLSDWFLIVTSFGALFIVTGKRSSEIQELGGDATGHRAVLSEYTASFLKSTLTVTAAVTVTAYCLWAFERGHTGAPSGHHVVWFELTIAPVIIGVLYVLRLIDAGKGGAPEELVLSDRTLQVLGVVWIALLAAGVYA